MGIIFFELDTSYENSEEVSHETRMPLARGREKKCGGGLRRWLRVTW